jgi:flagellar hook assembly protein FlgD
MTNVCGSVTPPGVTLTTKQCLLSNSPANNEKIISSAIQIKVAPNPFSNSTTVSFSIQQSQKAMPADRHVSIQIFDLNGRLVKTLADAQMQAGTHQLIWNAKDEKGNGVVTGIYLLKIQAGSYAETKKLVVEK